MVTKDSHSSQIVLGFWIQRTQDGPLALGSEVLDGLAPICLGTRMLLEGEGVGLDFTDLVQMRREIGNVANFQNKRG